MLLEVKHLNKEYIRGGKPFSALKDVQLQLNEGDSCIIIGRSGSGKSTLLNLIGGLLLPTSGKVCVEGRNVAFLNDTEASQLRNCKIGFIPQGQSILSNLTVLDNVRLPYFLCKREGDATDRALSLLKQVGIAHLASSYPQHLSGGELRRVTIARSLINNPKLLLADEPTSDLDTQTTTEVMQLFSEIAKSDTAVLLVTHDLNAIDYGNCVYKMSDGELNLQIT